jgi:catechol 2,3-dioxygenase-like lactoylglutathione lyase family enzyme
MATISNGAPIFAVRELSTAVDFYVHKLGFTVQMQTTDPVPYAIVGRDDVMVHLTVDDARRGKGAMYAITDDVDGLHSEFAAKGVRIVEPPDDRAYGMRDMYFNDCCDNMIGFGQPLNR